MRCIWWFYKLKCNELDGIATVKENTIQNTECKQKHDSSCYFGCCHSHNIACCLFRSIFSTMNKFLVRLLRTCCTLRRVVNPNIEYCKIRGDEQKKRQQAVDPNCQLCTLHWIFCFFQRSLFFSFSESESMLSLFALFLLLACYTFTSMISVLLAMLLLVFYVHGIPTDSHFILLI